MFGSRHLGASRQTTKQAASQPASYYVCKQYRCWQRKWVMLQPETDFVRRRLHPARGTPHRTAEKGVQSVQLQYRAGIGSATASPTWVR